MSIQYRPGKPFRSSRATGAVTFQSRLEMKHTLMHASTKVVLLILAIGCSSSNAQLRSDSSPSPGSQPDRQDVTVTTPARELFTLANPRPGTLSIPAYREAEVIVDCTRRSVTQPGMELLLRIALDESRYSEMQVENACTAKSSACFSGPNQVTFRLKNPGVVGSTLVRIFLAEGSLAPSDDALINAVRSGRPGVAGAIAAGKNRGDDRISNVLTVAVQFTQ